MPDACGAQWTYLGSSLAGTGGVAPTLVGTGGLCGGDWGGLDFTSAAPAASAWMIIGLSNISVPFKQVAMVPSPELVLPVGANIEGELSLGFSFPAGMPPATELFIQAWVLDAEAPGGFAGSSALRLTTP